MLEFLESEPFQTYATVVVGTVILGSHGIIYLLSIVGLLLRPFSQTLWDFSYRRRPSLPASSVVFLYPWIHLWGKPPRDIARTPFRPSRLLLIHSLWLINSVGLYVGTILYLVVMALAYQFPDISGIERPPRSDFIEPSPLTNLLLFMYIVRWTPKFGQVAKRESRS